MKCTHQSTWMFRLICPIVVALKPAFLVLRPLSHVYTINSPLPRSYLAARQLLKTHLDTMQEGVFKYTKMYDLNLGPTVENR